MENCKYIVILGHSQNINTWAIIESILDTLDLPREIYFNGKTNLTKLSCKKLSSEDFENPKNSDSTQVYFIAAERHLAEQVHQLYHWHQKYHFEISSVISILDRSFFKTNCPNLRDAMAHFSDLLLIDNTLPIPFEQLKTYTAHCKKKECYPLAIQTLTKPDVSAVRELYDSRPRRMTLIFDDIDPIDFIDESSVGQAPFTIPTLDQCDKYLKQDEQGRYLLPIESL